MINSSNPTLSFCIITNGRRPRKLNKLLRSIHSMNIPTFEIIICGYLEKPPPNVTYIADYQSAETGKLGKMRNKACSAARYDVLVVTDDDVLFDKNFYMALCKIGLNFDIACSKFLNPDGSRYWDWAIDNNEEHRLIQYHQTHSDIYITGGRCIMTRKVFDHVRWSEILGFYEREDVDYTHRIKEAGFKIQLFEKLVITHNDWTYTQRKYMVRHYGIFKVVLRMISRRLKILNDDEY
ncbi:MAG: glycosyltransferase [Methylococcaceae bacterium]